jgi:hypothetical protein
MKTKKKTTTTRTPHCPEFSSKADQTVCPVCGHTVDAACVLCGSAQFIAVDHIDGDEANFKSGNLRLLCRFCKASLDYVREAILARSTRVGNAPARSMW